MTILGETTSLPNTIAQRQKNKLPKDNTPLSDLYNSVLRLRGKLLKDTIRPNNADTVGPEKVETVKHKKASIKKKGMAKYEKASTVNKKIIRKGMIKPKKTDMTNQDKTS